MSDRRVGPPPAKPGASTLIRAVRENTAQQNTSVPVPEPATLDPVEIAGEVPQVSPAGAAVPQPTTDAQSDAKVVKITVTVGEGRRARLRSAYTLTHVQERHRTFSDFIAATLDAEVERLEQKYNDGRPFDNAEDGVIRGRPLGS
ncbi:hypothetical protein ACIRCZ_19730 [Leifsonia sp. NPDC102414]|uniref:ParB family protein n=1 Tax=Leifsonia sp. NPDC102414 TaxID=3364124 RepID=UPI00382F59C1